MQTLRTSQLKAAAFLADGMSKTDVAMSLDVHVRTITRWGDSPEFQREVSDRGALREAGERISEAKQVSPSGFNLAEAIADLREAKKTTRPRLRAAGSSLLEKGCERLQDLPAEAIAPKDLPQFFRVGQELLQWADAQESEELAISELTIAKAKPFCLSPKPVFKPLQPAPGWANLQVQSFLIPHPYSLTSGFDILNCHFSQHGGIFPLSKCCAPSYAPASMRMSLDEPGQYWT